MTGPEVEQVTLTTEAAVEAIAWGRAQKWPNSRINLPVVCADGFEVSVQASASHYAQDSHPSGEAAYWRGPLDDEPAWPFVSFEVGYPTEDPTPAEVWDEYEGGGVWAWVPRQVVADLLDSHGGAVAWKDPASKDD